MNTILLESLAAPRVGVTNFHSYSTRSTDTYINTKNGVMQT
jgi:hypothetical protein